MTRWPILRPAAELDVAEAALWYDTEHAGLGSEFLLEVEHVLERVAEERLLALATLTEQAWGLSGKAAPQYAREDAPIRIVPLHGEPKEAP